MVKNKQIILNQDTDIVAIFKNRQLELDITESQISKKAGLNRSTVSMYWNKKRVPTLQNTLKIAAALDIEIPLIML